MTNKELEKYCNNLLKSVDFKDYCPNGLQIEGKKEIKKIITGVSCNLDLIQQAIKKQADTIIVHHGFFWKNEKAEIVGIKYQRIKLLIENNINLYAYHLPLDAHPELGNNKQLAIILNIKNPKPLNNSLIWTGEVNLDTDKFLQKITNSLARKPQIFNQQAQIKNIAFCTGAAHNYINDIVNLEIDCYLSGEISENIPAIAKENNITYIQAGHHATEQGGVLALGKHLKDKFDLDIEFIDIKNSV